MANEQVPQRFGIAGLITGILSLIFLWVPLLGLTLGSIAIISSALQMKKGHSGMAVAGLITGICGAVAGLVWIVFISAAVGLGITADPNLTQ